MGWRHHPTRTPWTDRRLAPDPVPMSLPMGITALDGYQCALTVPVLITIGLQQFYRAKWRAELPGFQIGIVPIKAIDWSTTL